MYMYALKQRTTQWTSQQALGFSMQGTTYTCTSLKSVCNLYQNETVLLHLYLYCSMFSIDISAEIIEM
jgi:hypothetical protein